MKNERDGIWLRLKVPNGLHESIKDKGEEEGEGIIRITQALIERGLSQSELTKGLIKILDPGADEIEVSERKNLTVIRWLSDGVSFGLVYDSEKKDFIHNVMPRLHA